MKKLYLYFAALLSTGLYSQSILNQAETGSRTVSDPQAVVLAPGFHATSSVSNPFVAKIGTSSETPQVPVNTNAGSTNPSGPAGDTSLSFHDTQGSIEVNGGGQLQYTLPIALPPGVKSVAPQVNLVYTSGSGNGIAGYGWNLSGITSISRIGRNIEKDGSVRGIKLDYSDYYSFNGQRLILKSGEYGKDGAEYVTEKFSNVKIKSFGRAYDVLQALDAPAYFEVTFEDGSQAWYGSFADDPAIGAPGRTLVEYNIVKWKDAQGNYITYNYTQANNVTAISNIQWGGNETLGKLHFNKMVFNYNTTEARSFKEQSYLGGVSFVQDKLLSNVIVYTNSDVSVATFKTYEINYKKLGTSYQFVDNIREKNSVGESANDVKFTYSESTASEEFLHSDKDMSKAKKIYADFNLDGIADYIEYSGNKIFYKKSVYVNSQPMELSHDSKFSESDFKLGMPINFKDENNFVKNLTGIVIPVKINGTVADRKNYEFRVYSVDISTGSLKYEFSKIIDYNQYHLYDYIDDEGGGVGNQCTANPTNLTSIRTYDYNGDGIDELLLGFSRNIRCRPAISNPDDPTPPAESRTHYANAFYNFSNDQNAPGDFLTYDGGNENTYSFDGGKFGDFDGDGVVDILTNSLGNIKIFNIVKNSNGTFSKVEKTTFSHHTDGLYTRPIYGDFNGDSRTDFIVPQGDKTNNWFMYLSTGNNFTKVVKNNFIYYSAAAEVSEEGLHNTFFESGCSYGTYTYHEYVAEDLNNDGKSELVVKKMVLRNHQWNNHYDKESTKLSIDVYSNLSGYQPNGDIIFSNIFSRSYDFQDKVVPFSMLTLNKGNKELVVVGQPDDCIHNNCDYNYAYHFEFLNVQNHTRIKTIQQGGIITNIDYKELDPAINPGLYAPVKKELYPYLEMDKVSKSYVVSQLRQEGRKQDFKYRGFLSHMQGRGMMGFRQTAKSSWYADGLENTVVWSAGEMDPLNEGVPIKEWTVKISPLDSNANTLIFNTAPNDALKSLQQTTYITRKLLNGNLVTSYSDADKPKIVTAIVSKSSISQDYIKDINTFSEIKYDFEDSNVPQSSQYYLPVKTESVVNQGFATSQTTITYTHNPAGTGKDYYIGRPESKIESATAYSSTKSTEEYYSYENNLLSVLSKKPTFSAASINESYQYDGWGNITEKTTIYKRAKVTTPPSLIQVQKSQYDDKGRFTIKKIDNLGLETNITYNDWGQILTQTDPLGALLTNTYDGWGKLLISKNDFAGVTTYTKYTYAKSSNGGSIITQYDPDGNISRNYTNKLGQEYKTQTKVFGQNNYAAKYKVYDILGRKKQESEPYFDTATEDVPSGVKWNTITYDDSFYPAKVTAKSFTAKEMETSVNSRTTTIKEVGSNSYQRTTTKTTDALGNVITSTDKGGTINFTYDAAGHQITAQYGTNVVTTTYDDWGRKIEFADPSNGTYNYDYDGFGRILMETSPKGTKEYIYNSFGQLYQQKELSNDGTSTNKSITYSYNAKGLITGKVGTANGKSYSTNVNYDNYGRTISSSESNNGKYFMNKGITYDDKLRISSYEKSLYSSGVYTKVLVENIYDPWSGELSQIKDKNQNKVLWALQTTEADGRVLTANLGGASLINQYDSNNFLYTTQHKSTANGTTILQMTYGFDAIKNELKYRTRGGDFNISESFQYDDNNRLVNWTNPVTSIFTQNAFLNTYDIRGRITNNDQVGEIKFNNNDKIYQATGMVLNASGQQNYNEKLLQKITYNENNDPIFIDGLKGDVAFTYGLTEMRQMVTYGGNFSADGTGKFTKYYSEDGSYEIVRNNQTGQEKHILYLGGSPYESNIVYLKDFNESAGSYKFLHKDYLGSILAISDETGNAVEQRHYDAWGNFTHLKVGTQPMILGIQQVTEYLANNNLLLDRGYTSHEHFSEVGLIHMNGRLYDPLLRRFLNADENIQDMYNTQNYNKYGYVMNNPLMYNDASGELWELAALGIAAAIGAIIGAATYMIMTIPSGQFSFGGFFKSVLMGAVSGAVTYGIGSVFSSTAANALMTGVGEFGKTIIQGAVHGIAQGTLSMMQGGKFLMAAASGFFGNLGAYGFGKGMASIGLKEFANNTAGTVLAGAVLGGVGSSLTGGNFWQGAVIGGVVAGLNHTLHKAMGPYDPRKPIGSKRLKSTSQDHSLAKGSRGGQSTITQENPGNQVGNGKGMFVPTGSQSMTTSDLTYYDDGTVDVNMTTQVARMNTTGSYIANYDVVGPNGNIIDAGFLIDKGLGIDARMDYKVYTGQGSAAVLSTAKFTVPLNSTIRVNVGLTYKIPAGQSGAIITKHIIHVVK